MRFSTAFFRCVIPVIAVFIVALSFMASPQPAYAAEVNPGTAIIPVKQAVTPDGAEPIDVSYTLKPALAENPMPEGTVDGTYTIVMKGADTSDIVIPVSLPGVYEYTMYCSSNDIPHWNLPQTTRLISVYVTNDGRGGLTAAVVVSNSDGTKDTSASWDVSFDYIDFVPPTKGETPVQDKGFLDQTGDKFPLVILIAVIGVAAIGFIIFLVKRRRDRD